jgi:hypothetical protein
VSSVKILPGLGDHDIPCVDFSVKPSSSPRTPRRIWLYKNADWEGMADYLRPLMKTLDQAYYPCVEELWREIKHHIQDASELFIPRKTAKRKDLPLDIERNTTSNET